MELSPRLSLRRAKTACPEATLANSLDRGSSLGCKTEEITGAPDPKHISTSYVERQNLTMRNSKEKREPVKLVYKVGVG